MTQKKHFGFWILDLICHLKFGFEIFPKGQAILTAVIFLLFISMAVLFGFSAIVFSEVRTARGQEGSARAYMLAEAGLEDIMYRVNSGMQYDSSEMVALDGETSAVSVAGAGLVKEIIAQGSVDSRLRKVKAALTTTSGTSFNYGLQVGSGGLEMAEASRIEGSIYSEGPVDGDQGNPGSRITGDVFMSGGSAPIADQSSMTQNSDLPLGPDSQELDAAQSFILATTSPLYKASLLVKKVGNPNDAKIRIISDGGGVPSRTEVAFSVLDKDNVDGSYKWVDVYFGDEMLEAGTRYWLLFESPGGSGASKHFAWGLDTGNPYASGKGMASPQWDTGTPVWNDVGGDLAFQVWVGDYESIVTDMQVDGILDGHRIEDTSVGGSVTGTTIVRSTVGGNTTVDYCSDTTIGGNLSFNTRENCTVGGAASSPASLQPDPAPIPFPFTDVQINDWKNSAESSGVTAGPITYSGAQTLDSQKITGDVTVEEDAVITLNGPIWVTGNLSVEEEAIIKLSAAHGELSDVLIVDGWIHGNQDVQYQGSGETGSYLIVIGLSSCDGTSGGECTHHAAALDVHEGEAGVYYVPNGLIHIHPGSGVKGVVAYKLELTGAAIIRYETGLANIRFSSGPGGGFQIQSWKEVE